jgi:hypothetical protein
MERIYNRITKDINKTTTLAIKKAIDLLHNRIVSMSACIALLQQQVLTYQCDIQRSLEIPAAAPTVSKRGQGKQKEKLTANPPNVNTNGKANPTYAAVAAAVPSASVPTVTADTTGWTTLKIGGQKDKKIPTPKLIPTTYPQTEREVTC